MLVLETSIIYFPISQEKTNKVAVFIKIKILYVKWYKSFRKLYFFQLHAVYHKSGYAEEI